MNTRPDAGFSLAPAPSDSAPATLDIPADRMVHLALMNRPELREQAYDARINEKEATAALLELLPGIDLSAGVNANSNSYLMNKTWVSWRQGELEFDAGVRLPGKIR